MTFRSPQSDERLVQAAQRGDEHAIEELYGRYADQVLRYCAGMLRSLPAAEDVQQDVFVSVVAALRRGMGPNAFGPWVFRVAHNACITHMRARREAPTSDLELEQLSVDPELGWREDLRQLLADIDRLSAVQRGALLLREMHGFSHAEIGAVLGMPAPAARSAIFRARRTLQGLAEARDADCRVIQAELADLADRRGRRRRALTAHLEVCESCRTFRDGLRARPALLRGFLPAPAVVPLAALVSGAASGGGSAAGPVVATASGASAGVAATGPLLGAAGGIGGCLTAGNAVVAALSACALVAGTGMPGLSGDDAGPGASASAAVRGAAGGLGGAAQAAARSGETLAASAADAAARHHASIGGAGPAPARPDRRVRLTWHPDLGDFEGGDLTPYAAAEPPAAEGQVQDGQGDGGGHETAEDNDGEGPLTAQLDEGVAVAADAPAGAGTTTTTQDPQREQSPAPGEPAPAPSDTTTEAPAPAPGPEDTSPGGGHQGQDDQGNGGPGAPSVPGGPGAPSGQDEQGSQDGRSHGQPTPPGQPPSGHAGAAQQAAAADPVPVSEPENHATPQDEVEQGQDEQGQDEQGQDEPGQDEQGQDEQGQDERGQDEPAAVEPV